MKAVARFVPIALIAAWVGLAPSSSACSVELCLGRGVAMRQNFTVGVTLNNKPLARVTVEVYTANLQAPYLTRLTNTAGEVSVRKLPPGDYWIGVTYLGVQAGSQCFRVPSGLSLRAKRHLNYRWGDYGLSMQVVAGSVREWQSSRSSVPMSAVKILLRNPVTRETLQATSDSAGEFAFPPVKDGTYALHIEGTDGDAPTDLVIQVDQTSSHNSLTLTRGDSGCGGFWFRPDLR